MGRDELNLVDFPIGALTYQQPTGPDGKRLDELVFSVESFDDQVGRIVPRKVTTRTSSRFGFPTPKEEQLLVGLMLLSRLQNNFTNPRVHFLNGELLKLMGWADNGDSRRQLREGLDRLQGVDLKYENSWSTDEGAKYEKEFKTGILDSYELTSLRSGRGRSGERSWVQWSAEVFADIQKGNVKELNTSEFFSLQRPVAQRMYRFLDKHLAIQPGFEMELMAFAGHLGMTATTHVGKIKERLRPAIAELEALPGFIEAVAVEDRYHRIGRGHWLIRFRRTKPVPRSTPQRVERKPVSPVSSTAADLVIRFYKEWSGTQCAKPTVRELAQAQEVLQEYGQATDKLLGRVIRIMRTQFPNAVAFGGTMRYWPEAAKTMAQAIQRDQQKTEQLKANQQEAETKQQGRDRKERLREKWNSLTEDERREIRNDVAESANVYVQSKLQQEDHDDLLMELACLDALEQRLAV